MRIMTRLSFSPEVKGERLDIYLAGKMEGYTRSSIARLIDEELVSVNGKHQKAGYKTRLTDIIEVDVYPPKECDILPEDIPLDIIYEDKDLIVINKPKGMVVHPAPGHYNGTLVNALLHHCKGSLSGINGEMRPGIVHRIDMETSGVLVAAKTDETHRHLSHQFQEHTINRIYTGLVHGNIKEDSFTVDKPIGRSTVDRKKMAVSPQKGRRAVTHITVKKRYGRYTLVEAKLETGRTHQIRVHMSNMGFPLVGDTVYSKQKNFTYLKGQALHARLLGFEHPGLKRYMEFEADLPPWFTELIKKVEN